MAKQYDAISDELKSFIKNQKVYFVGTAATEGRVNVSPKGMDSLRVMGPNRVIWLNLTGSGNESAAHLLEVPRMTIMFCAFEGRPMILRLYGKAKAIHERDELWNELIGEFGDNVGARQIFDLDVELVQTSCGFAVPNFDFIEERDILTKWADKKGREGVVQYWRDNNIESIDGKPTRVFEPER